MKARVSTEQLQAYLAQATVHLERLYELACEKQRLIQNRDGAALSSLLEDEARVAEALARLEEERMALAEELGWAGSWGPAGEEGGPPGPEAPPRPGQTLSDWLQQVPAEDQEPLREQVRGLRTLMERLAAQNEVNKGLLKEELAYIQFALEVLTGPSAADFVYSPERGRRDGEGPVPPGAGNARGGRGLFDFRV